MDRSPLKKPRDIMQSRLVTQMADKCMKNIDIEDYLSKAKHFKVDLINSFRKNILSTVQLDKIEDKVLDIELFI